MRTLQPALEELDAEIEEAAASLGCDARTNLLSRYLPNYPAGAHYRFRFGVCTCIGEYGFSGVYLGKYADENEITSLLIIPKLEQYVRLRRRDSHRSRHVARFVPDSAGH